MQLKFENMFKVQCAEIVFFSVLNLGMEGGK